MNSGTLGFLAAVASVTVVSAAPSQKPLARTAPETFTTPVQGRTELSSSAAMLEIRVERYLTDAERKVFTDALTSGGQPALVKLLRAAPAIGYLKIGDEQFPLRWSRQQSAAKNGRTLTLVTDAPVFFLGGGRADAKPREGYDLAVVQLAVDEFGFGSGTMAAAAKVKVEGQGGVAIEDYGDQPIKLTFVYRATK